MLTGINYPSNKDVPDVVSVTITASGYSSIFTPSYGQAYALNLNISSVTGITPSLIVAVQESLDGGVSDWSTVYTFPAITTAFTPIIYDMPARAMTGSVIRYQYTITGTTPSFTFSINRTQLASVSAVISTSYSNSATSTLYRASIAGTGYNVNDLIEYVNEYNLTTNIPVYQNTTYYNITQGTTLSSAPTFSNLYPVQGGSIIGNAITVDYSGTITTGGTAQQLLAANTSRAGWVLVNKSNSIIYVNELVTATGGNSDYPVMPNETYPPIGAPVTTGAISIISSQTGAVFYCRSWNNPSVSESTLFVSGATPAGQALSASSYPVVPASNYTESTSALWVVAIAGTGYNPGDTLQQTIKSNAGTVSQTWFNLTQGTIITTPTTAQIASNLTLSGATVGQSSYRSLSRWWVSQGNFAISSGNPFVVIRNTTSNPLRLVDFSLTGVSNTWATASTSNVIAVSAILYTGVTAVTSGTTTNSIKCVGSTYSSDSTVTLIYQYTSVTATGTYNLGTASMPMPFVGPTSGLTSSTGFCSSLFGNTLTNLIIPSGAALALSSVGTGTEPTSQTLNFVAQLTLDL